MNSFLFLTVLQTCKRLNETSREHQTWLDRVRLLQIPISTNFVPSTAELKDWAVSWLRSDKRWVKQRLAIEDLSLDIDDSEIFWEGGDYEPARFVMANIIPGGRFVVVLYFDGDIDLKAIDVKSEDEWELRDVAQYRGNNDITFCAVYWSQLLAETNLGRPLVAYVDQGGERYDYFLRLSAPH